MSHFKILLIFLINMILSLNSFAISTTYVSKDDIDITMKKVLVTQGYDNIHSIYSKPLSDYLKELVDQDKFLELLEASDLPSFDLETLRSQPKVISEITEKHHADSLIHIQIAKGQMGLRYELALFTSKSGLIWAYADFLEKENFDLSQSKTIIKDLYLQLMNQIPYQGLILSRLGQKVTVSRGISANLRTDQEINIIQIVSVSRHPKFQFVTETQKEIIGKIRLTKVDENLSFGYILYEKEPQAIQPGLKLLLKESIYYSDIVTSANQPFAEQLIKSGEDGIVLKGDTKEWVPENQPTFGRMHILLGGAYFSTSTTTPSIGAQQGSTFFSLNAEIDSDLWLTPSWFIKAGFRQGAAQVENPMSGSSPKMLNFSLQGLKLAGGYNINSTQNVYGSRIQALLGYAQFNALVTESTCFNSISFNGLGIGLGGYLPWNEAKSLFGMGAEIWYYLNPNVTESPHTSGNSEAASMMEIAGSLYYHWTPNMYLMGKLASEAFHTEFSGVGTRTPPATSTELNWTRINVGVEVLF